MNIKESPINWNYVDDKWNVLAIDDDGEAYFYEQTPIASGSLWEPGSSNDCEEITLEGRLNIGQLLEQHSFERLIWYRPGYKGVNEDEQYEDGVPEEQGVSAPWRQNLTESEKTLMELEDISRTLVNLNQVTSSDLKPTVDKVNKALTKFLEDNYECS